MSAVGWVMRIAEDDGEVDDEWPPPDRTAKIAKFNFDAYAVLEASPAQLLQNQALEAKIQRHPSRVIKPKQSLAALPSTAPDKLAIPAPSPMVGSAPGPSTASHSTSGGGGGGGGLGGGGLGVGSVPLSTSLMGGAGQGPPMFLRVRVADMADAVHVSTTIEASAGMYMQEVLESVCKKRKMVDWREYALVLRLPNVNILVPLDRTVAALQGKQGLYLVKRTMLDGPVDFGASFDNFGPGGVSEPTSQTPGPGHVVSTGLTTDPNASIFTGADASAVPGGKATPGSLGYNFFGGVGGAGAIGGIAGIIGGGGAGGPGYKGAGYKGGGVGGIWDLGAGYKGYTIWRKMPMLVARQEKTLAIDGMYIHIMPPPNRAKAVFDSGKTHSYHIKSIAECEQSSKSSCIFKIVLHRSNATTGHGHGHRRRYDFEADSTRSAAEIVNEIKTLKASFEKYGTTKNSGSRRKTMQPGGAL